MNRLAKIGFDIACEWRGNVTKTNLSSVNVTIIQGDAARQAFRNKAKARHMVCFWSVILSGISSSHWSTISLHVVSMKCVMRKTASEIVSAVRYERDDVRGSLVLQKTLIHYF
jgi:hypothetical protein